MFTKIYYINLDRRIDRNDHILEQLEKINYEGNVERISAVDAKKLNYDSIPKSLITEKGVNDALNKNQRLGVPLTKGAIGCALSHKIVFEKILYGDDEYVLIIEDDIKFDNNFNEKLKNIFSKVPDFDVLYLGYSLKKNISTNEVISNLFNYVPDGTVHGTFGYIINKKAASKMIDVFPITLQVDTEISTVFPKLKVYTLIQSERIILSDDSSLDSQFSTDIQRRDDILSNDAVIIVSNNSLLEYPSNILLLIVIHIIILFIIYYCYIKK
jgi:GR25 family glycosyltransferase involved in LPS biosynthesis